jgi:hypothetical protein
MGQHIFELLFSIKGTSKKVCKFDTPILYHQGRRAPEIFLSTATKCFYNFMMIILYNIAISFIFFLGILMLLTFSELPAMGSN